MVLQWMILASAVSLALGSKLTTVHTKLEQIIKRYKFPLAAECCKVNKMIPNIFRKVPMRCLSSALEVYRAEDNETMAEKVCDTIECFMTGNMLFEEDKTVKENEVRKLFMDGAKREVEGIIEAALDKCFDNYKKKVGLAEVTEKCKSSATLLITCITNDALSNCPQTFWHKRSKPQCRGEKKKDE